jgi:hypothetical protein
MLGYPILSWLQSLTFFSTNRIERKSPKKPTQK